MPVPLTCFCSEANAGQAQLAALLLSPDRPGFVKTAVIPESPLVPKQVSPSKPLPRAGDVSVFRRRNRSSI